MGQLSDYYNEPQLSHLPGWKGNRLYRRYLTNQLRGEGLGAEQSYRNEAYSGVAGQQAQSDMAAKRTLASGFGSQNPTGLSTAVMSQNALNAPYGEANLGAQEAGRRSMINIGSARDANRLNQVSMYNSLFSNLLAERNLQLQQQALEDQNALALAASAGGSSGGGSGGAFLGGLGQGIGGGMMGSGSQGTGGMYGFGG